MKMNTNFNYDSVSHLLSVLHQAGNTTIDGASYVYDPAGNRTSKGNYLNGLTSNYTYDQLYELTQVTQGGGTTESYNYDPVGNRLSSLNVPSYNYNPSNELTSTSNGTYTYDANGNTLTDPSGKTYTWDFENRLTQVVVPGVGTTTFKYDPYGRRVQKSSALGTTNYLYDGANVIEEANSNGNVLARYTHPLVLDEPLAEVRSGSTAYYQADGSGSITSLTLPSSATSATYNYDSYGNVTASTGSTTNLFRYVGREFDAESGIYYYRARYYDQTQGKFISEDPVGFHGSLNFYAYVRNNPLSFVDPMGLCTQISPWVQIPSASPPAQPFKVVPDGFNWQKVDWGFMTILGCYCDWVPISSRVKAYYYYTIVESAKFNCDPCDKIVTKTRTRTEDIWRYEEGVPVMSSGKTRTYGKWWLTGNYADDSASTDSAVCNCKPPTN